MTGGQAIVIHSRRCGNSACGAVFGVCDHCDRGQRYCSPTCRRQARACQHREANRRYQNSFGGRHNHSHRQQRYRQAKNKVTDTGSQTQASGSIVEPCHPRTQDPGEPSTLRCVRCGRIGAVARNQLTMPTTTTPPTPTGIWPAELYIAWVLSLYVELPHTPARANAEDRAQAQRLFARRVPNETVEAALLLASLRRLYRSPQAPPLPAIRSLAYFQPVIEELLAQPNRRGYLEYLRHKFSTERERPAAPEQRP